MLALLNRLEQDRGLVRNSGARARRAFEECYDRPIGVARILSILGLLETSHSTAACAAASSLSGSAPRALCVLEFSVSYGEIAISPAHAHFRLR